MINNSEIAFALLNHLKTLPNSPPLIVEGAGQNLPTGEVYLTEKFMPAEPDFPTVSKKGYQVSNGMYQVDVRNADKPNKWLVQDLADNVATLFVEAVTLQTQGGSVKILGASSSPLRSSGDHQAISVTINYITAR